jgi:serine phosphatase RsbU (regulator of sigma subunit)
LKLACAWRTRPCSGEHVNGDAVLVRREGGRTLLALVDALGHGVVAAKVAADAMRCLEQVPLTTGAHAVVDALHAALRGGRGAAAMLGVFDGHTLSCGGVGNVELRTQGTKVPILAAPGILGQQVRHVRAANAVLALGDRLVLFSDGLSSRLELDLVRGLAPEAACVLLMERYGRDTDDATVLVADVESE